MESAKIKNETIYFDDYRIAAQFAVLFLNMSRLIWLDPTSHGGFLLLVKILKTGLAHGLIGEEDFWTVDADVINKLKKTRDPEVNKMLKRLTPGHEFEYCTKEEAEFGGDNKPRMVDPLVLEEGKFVKVSDIVPNLKQYFEEFRARYKTIYVKPVTR